MLEGFKDLDHGTDLVRGLKYLHTQTDTAFIVKDENLGTTGKRNCNYLSL